MKWLVFTDLQLKQDRLEDQKKVLDYIIDKIFSDDEIKALAFLGDGFDNRKNVTADMLKIYSNFFGLLHKKLETIVIVAGNHDKPYNDALFSFFTPFSKWNNVYVVEDDNLLFFRKMLFIPFFSEKKLFNVLLNAKKERKEITLSEYIFMHFGLNGVPLDTGSITKSKIGFNLLKKIFPNLKKVISGHYHNRKMHLNGKVIYIGNPLALSYSEEEKKGITIFNESNGKLEFIELDFLPKFKTIKLKCNVNDYKKAKDIIKNSKNDYVRFLFEDEKEKLATIPEDDLYFLAKNMQLRDIKIVKNPFEKESIYESDIVVTENIIDVYKEYAKQENLNKEELEYGLTKLKKSY